MSVGEWIRPHSEVEMDTRLEGLSQPPSLQAAGASLCLEQRLKDAGQAGLALLGLLTPHLHHRHSSGVGTQHPECLWLGFFTC